jgi:hypothetical protein
MWVCNIFLEYIESPDVNMTLSVNDIFSVVCGITVFSFISVSAFEKYGVFSLLIFQKTIMGNGCPWNLF